MKSSKRTPQAFLAKQLASEALSWANYAIHAGSPAAAAKISHVQSADAGGQGLKPVHQQILAQSVQPYSGI
jgi:hypothetical protein